MNMIRPQLLAVMMTTIAGCLCITQPLIAQTPNYPVESDTLAILRIDLDRLDVQSVADWYSNLDAAQDQGDAVTLFADAAMKYVEALKSAKTSEVALTLAGTDLGRGMPLIMAVTERRDVVTSLLSKPWSMSPLRDAATSSKTIGNVLVFGSKSSVNRISSMTGNGEAQRFADGLNRKQLNHQLIVAIPDGLRQTLAAVWPDVTPRGSPIEFSPRQVISDAKSIRVEWSLPPQAAFETVITAIDPQAAKRLDDVVGELISQMTSLDDTLDRTIEGNVITITADASLTANAFADLLNRGYQQAQRAKRSNSMKQVGLAMHNFFAKEKRFPSDVLNRDGSDLLSWRVETLPHLDQSALFETIDLELSWDKQTSELVNQTAVAPYMLAGSKGVETTLRIPVIDGSLWNSPKTAKEFRSITDGTSNTIAMAVAPADQAVPWMKPGYWKLDEDELVESFFGDRASATVVFFDGSVHKLDKADMTDDKLKALLTVAGREIIDW